MTMKQLTALPPQLLPDGVRARFVGNNNGLDTHLLESGFEPSGKPVILLLHGFPELAFSWRYVLPELAQAGFHVIAPDLRGYGRTCGWHVDYDQNLSDFRPSNYLRDCLGLLAALNIDRVDLLVGHDFGSPIAATCTLYRPDIFKRLALMSAPFAGVRAWPSASERSVRLSSVETAADLLADETDPGLGRALGALPRPRKHYQWYYATREANGHMMQCEQGVHAFLRAYYHVKSADWPGNRPYALPRWDAESIAQMPTYYVMEADLDMAQTVAPFMPSASEIANCRWLSEPDLEVYSSEYERTGFQGGLQWYRCSTGRLFKEDLGNLGGRKIESPTLFVAGLNDWGAYQKPGALESMRSEACEQFLGVEFIPQAGHWVQQEQPQRVVDEILKFLAATRS